MDPGASPPHASALSTLLRRSVGGDAAAPEDRERAFAELVRLVMISIRATMGRRLRDHRESADVCQSVARSFVGDFDAGRIQFTTEAELAAYLQRIVRSKLADLARRDGALKRRSPTADGRPADQASISTAPSSEPTASVNARAHELEHRLLADLTEDEQTLIRLRRQGLEWDAIARTLNRDPAALRKQFSRLQDRLR